MKPNMQGSRLYSDRGQFVCWLNPQKQMVKPVKEILHMLRKPPGWAWDADVITNGIDRGALELVVYASDTDITYRTSIDNFMNNKGVIDRGHGKQWYLTLDRWSSSDREPEGKQLDMFKEET